jgi:hypothetical protein
MSKAKRYNPFDPKKQSLFTTSRGNFLYLFLAPLFLSIILALLAKDIEAFILNSIAFGLFFVTARLNRIGLKNEHAYHTTLLTKAPKTPFKFMAGILLGVSTLYTAWIAGGETPIVGLFLALISSTGYFLYYGFDPKVDKLENVGDISAEFVIQTLAESRAKLSSIENDIVLIQDQNLKNKLHIAVNKAYEILSNIEQDPKDLRVARKFIIVYIDGIKKVTKSYTDLLEEEIKPETKERLTQLLSDVEERFDKEILRLKRNNQFDLDVHIDVLQEQIKN